MADTVTADPGTTLDFSEQGQALPDFSSGGVGLDVEAAQAASQTPQFKLANAAAAGPAQIDFSQMSPSEQEALKQAYSEQLATDPNAPPEFIKPEQAKTPGGAFGLQLSKGVGEYLEGRGKVVQPIVQGGANLVEQVPGIGPALQRVGQTGFGQAVAGEADAAQDLVDGILSPTGLASFGLAALPATAQRVAAAGFAAWMLKQAPDQAKNLLHALNYGNEREIASALFGTAGTLGLAGAAAKGAITGEGVSTGQPPPERPATPAPAQPVRPRITGADLPGRMGMPMPETTGGEMPTLSSVATAPTAQGTPVVGSPPVRLESGPAAGGVAFEAQAGVPQRAGTRAGVQVPEVTHEQQAILDLAGKLGRTPTIEEARTELGGKETINRGRARAILESVQELPSGRAIGPKGPERANASQKQQATEVHGDVRTQPGQGERRVPEQGGGARVQPQAAGGVPEEKQEPPRGVPPGEVPLSGELPPAKPEHLTTQNADGTPGPEGKPQLNSRYYNSLGDKIYEPQTWVDWAMGASKINGTGSAYHLGLFLRQIEPEAANRVIDALEKAKEQIAERGRAALKKYEDLPLQQRLEAMTKDPDVLVASGSAVQLPREAWEAAMHEGSALSGGQEAIPESIAPRVVRTKEAPAEVPTETMFDPAKVPAREVPLSEITLSTDLPNFKAEADPDTGVVAGQELQGKYQRLGTAPIVLWRRLSGALEVITGRHRLDLARRTGETTIPAQIVDEGKGFTVAMAKVFDAESNIRDGQGSVEDYANYFKAADISREAAEAGGLLSRTKGRAGWELGKNAAPDLYDLWRNGKVGEAQAVEIARAAPGDARAQSAGIKSALAGKGADVVREVTKAAKVASATATAASPQGDLLGWDDAAIRQMEQEAERAVAAQRDLRRRLSAIAGAAKNPAEARREGLPVDNPAALKARSMEIRNELARWEDWPLHRDLVAKVRGEPEARPTAASPQMELREEPPSGGAKAATPQEEPKAPKLLPGEKQGDLITSTQQEAFKLVQETTTDAAKAAAEKAAKEAAAAEARTKQEKEQQKFTGLGGAVAEEFERGKGSATGIKNATVDAERLKRGLPPAMAAARRSFGETWDRAMAIVDRDPTAQDRLIAELEQKPRALNDMEDALLLHRQLDLHHEYDKATRDLAQGHDDKLDWVVTEARQRLAALSDQLLQLYDVGRRAGTETGRGLAARRMMAYEDYSLASMELQKRAANDGRPLTEAEHEEIRKLHERIAATQKAYDEYRVQMDAKLADLENKRAVAELKLEALRIKSRQAAAKAKPDLTGEESRLSAALGQEAKNRSPITKMTRVIQKLARNFVERGITDREALIDAVHKIVQDAFPEATRRQTMDAISGYGDFKQLSKDEISIQLRGMKGEMQQIAKLEDMGAGQPPLKTGLERRTPTDAERQLIKLVNDAKYRFQIPVQDPAVQLKSALDTLKTGLRNRIQELETKLAEGDFTTRKRRELVLDDEAQRLKAQYERTKAEFQRGLIRDRLKQRTPWEKTMDALVKWRRGFLLSGPRTLAKLTAAAVWRTVVTPAEEAIGAGIGKAIPGVAERAPRQGGLSTRAEARALTEGFTKGMRDAWQTLTTGHSDLDAVFGKLRAEPQSFIDLFGNVHGALKAPVKRMEFARSFQKRAEALMRQGVDVSNEMVQTRIGLEAYQDAERAIFLQPNRINAAYRLALRGLEKPDKATGKIPLAAKTAGAAVRTLLPIVRVPTNIVGETMEYAIGGLTGSARLARAYRNGIENLQPEEADLIMRQLKKGLLGGAALLLGWFAPKMFGGFYQEGEKRKKGDIAADAARVAGADIPPSLIHHPLVNAVQIGATARRVADSKLRKKDQATQGLTAGALAGALGLADQVPFIREQEETVKAMNPHERQQWFGELAKSLAVPQLLQDIAARRDVDAQGRPIPRQPRTTLEAIETGIPGLRERVPRKKETHAVAF